ncbi:MAG: MoxR family ATPase [Peptococcaceae bacterium]|nr:MoxR family ATPase [Peptococcaceae bacterium]
MSEQALQKEKIQDQWKYTTHPQSESKTQLYIPDPDGDVGNSPAISQYELYKSVELINKIQVYYKERIVGQERLSQSLLTACMSNGHILLESVPGLAKTRAARVLTECVSGTFSRIQCTPDLLPSDIIGTQIFNYANNTFETRQGPVHANFVLLDEINRSSAKTQSAMLEAMQEHQTSIGGVPYKMPNIFIVIATQNPIEQEGTYPLAEAQLDRFLLKEKLDYPNIHEELEILNRIEQDAFAKASPVLSLSDMSFLQHITKKVYVDDAIKHYIVNIIQATRHPQSWPHKELSQYVTLGSSPRGAIALMEAAKAMALIMGRTYATPDDVKHMRHSVLRHRIALNYAAIADGVSVETIIDALFGAILAP